jgi:uncharacterized repeat protein (TIGR04052 family)
MPRPIPFALTLLLLAGCSDPTDVEVRFAGLVDGAPAACGTTYDGLGATSASWTLEDFRLYVTDIRLLTAEGDEVPVTLEESPSQLEGTVLLDFEDGSSGCPSGSASTNTSIVGTVDDAGPFDGIRFTVGVPFDRNVANVADAPEPFASTAMFWNWQDGYKFIRIDGRTVTGDPEPLAWFLHLGSTGCDGDPVTGGTTTCANPNLVEVELTGFDPTTETISVDPAPVMAATDLTVRDAIQNGCMSNPMDTDCAEVFPRLGLPFMGVAPMPQQLFSAP